MHSRRLGSIAVVGACLLAGCLAPAPTPAPVPTYQCTPEAGGAEFECTQHQYDEMVAKDALYAEAEAVYRKFLAEDLRIMREGGTVEPTDVLLATAAGAFLEDVMSEYREMRRLGLKASGEDPVVEELIRKPGIGKGGSSVVMESCINSTGMTFTVGESVHRRGPIARDTVHFAGQPSFLRIIGADGHEVDQCED